MKTMRKVIILGAVLLGFATTSFAQLTVVCGVKAEIQSPTTIQLGSLLDFGMIYKNPSSAGTVTVKPQKALNSLATGGVSVGRVGEAASFHITGENGTTHNISLPQNPIVLSDGATPMAHIMNVMLDFSQPTPTGTPNPSEGSVTTMGTNDCTFMLGSGGQFTFYVGGKLMVNQDQFVGMYSDLSNAVVITINN